MLLRFYRSVKPATTPFMARTLLFSLNDISLTFGGKPVFEDLSMQILERERICLVGKNGAGKTTLMKLITNDLDIDDGERFMLPGITVGYLEQKVEFDPLMDAKTFVMSGLDAEDRESHAYLADIVMSPLDVKDDSIMGHLSGGQLRRAALARALVTEPDILLLDEPTNHLDVEAIEWLEGYLSAYNGALVCVSHDRKFLANISQKVLWIDRGAIRTCPHGYGEFEQWQEKIVEQEARELQNLSKHVQAEHGWTQGGVTGRRKRNVRRLRELQRLKEKLAADKAAYRQRSQKIDLDPLAQVNSSKIVAEFKHVSKTFERDGREVRILDKFSHTVMKGDRIGILGKNGSGKSTFLKMLTGALQPDSGNIFRSKRMDVSYFDQNRTELNPKLTLWETLCPDGGQDVHMGTVEHPRTMHVCGYLKRFLFDPATARNKVSTLSGGQQNRLLLAKILARPGNTLILDEPTNDLDMDTLDMLQDMLMDYPGTLLLVSHDRDFLDRCVTEMIAFEGDAEIHTCFGGYSDYLREKQTRNSKKNDMILPEKITLADEVIEAQHIAAKPLTYGERIELEKLPEEMQMLSERMEAMQRELDDAGLFQKNPDKFTSLISEFDAAKLELEAKETRWLELEERAMVS